MSATIRPYCGNQHRLRPMAQFRIINRMVFLDCESKIDKEKSIDKIEVQEFKMGCALYWNRKINNTKKITFWNVSVFWDFLMGLFDPNNHKEQEVYLFAHNTYFDWKMINGWSMLAKIGWQITFKAITSSLFLLEMKLESEDGRNLHYKLHVWDTFNYLPFSLAKIGEWMGITKLTINFKTCTDKQLEIYCERDVEIIYQFIKRLLFFLKKFNLPELNMTSASTAMNTFLCIFHHPIKGDLNTQIICHTHKQAILVERKSYKGGCVDVLEYGETHEARWKLDINSMYSKVMSGELPIRLIGTRTEGSWSQKKLWILFNESKKPYKRIATILFSLPKERALIIYNPKQISTLNKNVFVYTEGNQKLEISLCGPDLDYVQKYGTIHRILYLAIYAKGTPFKEYVEFFYALKVKFKKEKNKLFEAFCKLLLNSLYGKFGQREIITKTFSKEDCPELHEHLHKEIGAEIVKKLKESGLKEELFNKQLTKLETHDSMEYFLHRDKIQYTEYTENNHKDACVFIASYITSLARQMLVNYLLIAGKKNVSYFDTDSLFVNRVGFWNLMKANLISETEIGLLKIEDNVKEGTRSAFWGPKNYEFGVIKNSNEIDRKSKGVKHGSKILEETDEYIIFQNTIWDRYASDSKTGNLNVQIIRSGTKTVSKLYPKGKVLENNRTEPFSLSEILLLFPKKEH